MSGVRFRLRTEFRDVIPDKCSSERHRNFVRLPAGVLPRLYLSDQMRPWRVLLEHINLMTLRACSSCYPRDGIAAAHKEPLHRI